MDSVRTFSACGCLPNLVVVCFGMYGKRGKLRNERNGSGDPFIDYVNSENLPELMTALDALYYEHCLPFIPEQIDIENRRPTGTTDGLAARICGWFGDAHPTRTNLEKTREALAIWNIDRARPIIGASAKGMSDGPLYSFIPLEDIIKAREDLRRAALLMAWLLGKTDYDTAHGLPTGDKNARLRLMSAETPIILRDYYLKLSNMTDLATVAFNTHTRIDQMHLHPQDEMESAIHSYVVTAFTVMMSDQRKVMDEGSLKPRYVSNTILSAAWSHIADGLSKEGCPGAIGICKHCHRLFMQKRKTRIFCSDACRVMNTRSKAGKATIETGPYETAVMRYRREYSGHENSWDAAPADGHRRSPSDLAKTLSKP